ncbi:MAG TPA: hypothetical protein VGN69_01355 [Solirubrobacteraceae bacterium]|jgi:hypothetical protein|nr:hypothetical protein [Solirubrobacteraceae bacterium]
MPARDLLPGLPRRGQRDLSRFSARRDLAALWAKHFEDPREERLFIGTASFFATFALTRAITHSIRAGIGPFGNLSPGGKHIHHMTFGITALMITGLFWINEVGVGSSAHRRRSSRITAFSYGAGCALTLDEFALWLNLEDDYWSKEGRESIDAIVGFGCLLLLSLLGRNMLAELTGTLMHSRRQQAAIRARRAARTGPRRALAAARARVASV